MDRNESRELGYILARRTTAQPINPTSSFSLLPEHTLSLAGSIEQPKKTPIYEVVSCFAFAMPYVP